MFSIKNVLVIGTLLFISLFVTSAVAVEDYEEFNFTVSNQPSGTSITYRGYTSSDDFDMIQIDQKVKNWKLTYRNTDSVGNVEHRYRVTAPKVFSLAGFSVKPRAEWRSWESDAKDSYLRLATVIQTGGDLTENLSWFVDIQPKFAIGKTGMSDGRFESSQNDIGVDYAIDDVLSFGVFYEYNTDEDWELTEDFFGVNVGLLIQ
jgi:hypothetical protein